MQIPILRIFNLLSETFKNQNTNNSSVLISARLPLIFFAKMEKAIIIIIYRREVTSFTAVDKILIFFSVRGDSILFIAPIFKWNNCATRTKSPTQRTLDKDQTKPQSV